MLAVGASDERGRPAPFALGGAWVGVSAPGADIISTDPVPGTVGQISQFGTQGAVSPIQGTSFAAAYVTGLVALVRARFPGLRAPQVIARVERTAQHPSAPGGRDNFMGYGMINPRAALTDQLPGEDGSTPSPRLGPSVLPAARPQSDHDAGNARLVASTGSLGLLVAAAAGAVTMSTRRRRAAMLARRSALRAARRSAPLE